MRCGPNRTRQGAATSSQSRRFRRLYRAEDIRQDLSYLIVAERTNTNGSRQFKRLLAGRELGRPGQHGARRDARRHPHAGCLRRFRRPRRRARHAGSRQSLRQSGQRRPLMLDSTNPGGHGSGTEAGRRAVHSQFDEPRRRRREAGAASARWRRNTARRWSPARSTKTSSPRWRAPPSERSPSPRASATWR